jgi:hypothetical protein
MAEGFEQRVRSRSVDLVLILKDALSDPGADMFRLLCEQYGITCLVVDQGHSPAQIGEALRRGLLKTV